MPQFDLTHYGSQIFWFSLCFAILYFFVSAIILPRITSILQNRKNVINADLSSADALDKKIDQLQIETENLRKEAAQKYQVRLEEVAKNAAKQREKMIEEFKEKFEKITHNSRQELRKFIEQSNSQSEFLATDLAQKITAKLLKN
jgi:F-type H+-transporting ATPase subunit b